MVERLKTAIEKARAKRTNETGGAQPPAPVMPTARVWEELPTVTLDPARVERERIVSLRRATPAAMTFDVLRTRLLKVVAENGWTRIGVTSPTKGCGKTFVSANLALSLNRNPSTHVVLLDLDLRNPSLSRSFGIKSQNRIADALRGDRPWNEALLRVDDRLAVGLNAVREADSAELMQSVATRDSIDTLTRTYQPTVLLYDLPPLLLADDTLGFLGNLDGVIIVAAAGQSTTAHIDECARLIEGATAFLGVILNKVDDEGSEAYQYQYGAETA